jgi:predicted lipoprotein with Yx(FWY)xxD motif
MGMKSSLAIGVIGVAAIAAGAYWFTHRPAATKTAEVPVMTPAGILFSWVKMGNAVYVPGASSDQKADVRVFADNDHKTLYTYDKDPVGKSACTGECTKLWTPLAAPADGKPSSLWSVVTRDDGARQWALKGKPVYTSTYDKKLGDFRGDGLESGAWHVAFANMGDGMALPDGIAVNEVSEAGGQALVDSRGMLLYAFEGNPNQDKPSCGANPCPGRFTPLASGMLAAPVGDFTVINRDDGVPQWAYQGRALYTYEGDADLGDANGRDLDPHFQVAMVGKYFLPAGVSIRLDERRGGLVVNAEGKTLYARDRLYFNGTGGHYARGGVRGLPPIGIELGASACNDTECEKTWQPLKAPADAQPSGYWTLVSRSDGSRQWAYQGYALYSFTGDKNPGDTNGNDTFDLRVRDQDDLKIASGTKTVQVLDMGLGEYWRLTAP